jgi:hypothetical protein
MKRLTRTALALSGGAAALLLAGLVVLAVVVGVVLLYAAISPPPSARVTPAPPAPAATQLGRPHTSATHGTYPCRPGQAPPGVSCGGYSYPGAGAGPQPLGGMSLVPSGPSQVSHRPKVVERQWLPTTIRPLRRSDGKEAPFAGHALQLVSAAVFEFES